MFEQILTAALTELDAGRRVTMVSVASAHGSTPRAIGAVMLVGETGQLDGTIGGGNLEYQCGLKALEAAPGMQHFDLSNSKAATLGMVCGGNTDVLFTPLTDPAPFRQALAALKEKEAHWLLLPLSGDQPITVSASQAPELPDHPGLVDYECGKVLALRLTDPGRVYIMGGGHISLALSHILDMLEIPYLVVDDREEFSNPERYPNAVLACVQDLTKMDEVFSGSLAPRKNDCICIMTRGHAGDADATRFALRSEAGYIGVVGSAKKKAHVFGKLKEEGFTNVEERITTPIGLSIKAQTPAEIGISIAAQLILWRAENQ